MKTCIERALVVALVVALGWVPAGQVAAQTFRTLHSFTATDPNTRANSDGAGPRVDLILSGNTLYGTTSVGGRFGSGTVFAINTDGTGFVNLYSFSATSGQSFINNDGANPAGLVLSGNTLYGAAPDGGSFGNGTIFAVNTDGTGFTNLHTFYAWTDGGYPSAGLILSGSTLYGTAEYGGGWVGEGTVFTVNTNGTGFRNLHTLTPVEGVNPTAKLAISGNTLYGTAEIGVSSSVGTVFAVNTDGTGCTNLHTFTDGSGGAWPYAGVVLADRRLYGTTFFGAGSSIDGTVFAVNIDGSGFTNLHTFTLPDGGNPNAGLILSGDTLYGTTISGGRFGSGTVFAINTDGTGFTTLYSFTEVPGPFPQYTNSDGVCPYGGLVLSGDSLYGTASYGGSSGNGTVFSLLLPAPQLTVTPSRDNIVLTWPTNYGGFTSAGYTLQSTTNLGSPVWTTNLPASVRVKGQNTVTIPSSGTQQFFRLGK